jgi:hypothetical protein
MQANIIEELNRLEEEAEIERLACQLLAACFERPFIQHSQQTLHLLAQIAIEYNIFE